MKVLKIHNDWQIFYYKADIMGKYGRTKRVFEIQIFLFSNKQIYHSVNAEKFELFG